MPPTPTDPSSITVRDQILKRICWAFWATFLPSPSTSCSHAMSLCSSSFSYYYKNEKHILFSRNYGDATCWPHFLLPYWMAWMECFRCKIPSSVPSSIPMHLRIVSRAHLVRNWQQCLREEVRERIWVAWTKSSILAGIWILPKVPSQFLFLQVIEPNPQKQKQEQT